MFPIGPRITIKGNVAWGRMPASAACLLIRLCATMISRKPLICVSFAIAALVAILTFYALHQPRRGVTKERYDLLKPGLTETEVERLLYGSPRNDLSYPAIIWLPQATGKPISTEVTPATPAVELFSREDRPKNRPRAPQTISTLNFFPREAPTNGHQSVWITRTGLIAVYFGEDSKLRHKYTSRVYEAVRPSAFGWLASRPEMIRRSLGF